MGNTAVELFEIGRHIEIRRPDPAVEAGGQMLARAQKNPSNRWWIYATLGHPINGQHTFGPFADRAAVYSAIAELWPDTRIPVEQPQQAGTAA